MDKVDIWMPIFIGDYLADTQRLTTEQHGAYFLLLLDYWRKGPPPHDPTVLQAITRLDQRSWRKHEGVLMSLFELRNGQLFHGRLEQAKIEAINHRKRNSQRASNAAKARWNREDAKDNEAGGDPTGNAASIAKGNAPLGADEVHFDSPTSSPTPLSSSPPQPEQTASGTNEAKPIGQIARQILERQGWDSRKKPLHAGHTSQ